MLSKHLIFTGIAVTHSVLAQRGYRLLRQRHDEILKNNQHLRNVIERQNKQTRYLAELLDRREIRLEEFDKIALTSIHES